MAKGLGFNVESNMKAKNLKDGNAGWQPQPKGNQKIKSKLSIQATPSIPNNH